MVQIEKEEIVDVEDWQIKVQIPKPNHYKKYEQLFVHFYRKNRDGTTGFEDLNKEEIDKIIEELKNFGKWRKFKKVLQLIKE